jgi:hypothetical protein
MIFGLEHIFLSLAFGFSELIPTKTSHTEDSFRRNARKLETTGKIVVCDKERRKIIRRANRHRKDTKMNEVIVDTLEDFGVAKWRVAKEEGQDVDDIYSVNRLNDILLDYAPGCYVYDNEEDWVECPD